MNFLSHRKANSAVPTPLTADTALGDLDAMLCAVQCRLRAFADGVDLPLPLSLADQVDVQLRNGVLECVDALAQLHTLLVHEIANEIAHELAHRRRHEQVVIDAEAVLAWVPPELAARLGLTLCRPLAPPERIKVSAR